MLNKLDHPNILRVNCLFKKIKIKIFFDFFRLLMLYVNRILYMLSVSNFLFFFFNIPKIISKLS